jgi:hypothetical protein
LLQTQHDGGARKINPKPLKTRVTDRNYHGLHSCDFTLRPADLSARIAS